MAGSSTVFKTAQGEARFRAAYDETMRLWPIAYESEAVPTRFGKVQVFKAGPAGAPPLVLLHATNASSSMWYPNIGPLARSFRVYALDIIGHTGLSVPTCRIRTPQDCADWIVDVLDALGLDRVDAAGLSVGGWLALNLAVRAPHRVRRVVTMSPVGAFKSLKPKLLLRMLPMIFSPTEPRLRRYMDWVSAKGSHLEEALVQQFVAGMQDFNFTNPGLYQPRPFSDDELRGLQAPTLLLLGEEEVMFDRKAALARAVRLVPRLESEVVPGAGHFLTAEQPERVNARLLRFLSNS